MSTFKRTSNSSGSRPRAADARRRSAKRRSPIAATRRAPESAGRGARRTDGRGTVARVAIPIGAFVLAAVIALLVLSHLPVFVITGIDAQATEHISSDAIAKLAAVDEGTTLLNVDVGRVEQHVKKNPWVNSVTVTREFPDRLSISVEERRVFAIVVIDSGSSVWTLGEDGAWIEPVQLGESSDYEADARAKAQELGCLLITQVASGVDPAQGSVATDEVIQAVLSYQDGFSPELSSQVQIYHAGSVGSISMVLKSGLEVSLGAPTDIASKQAALEETMATYPGELTYVNVRVPTKPTYRKVTNDVIAGGATTGE